MRAQREDYDKLFSIWTKAFATVQGVQRKKQVDSFWNKNKHDLLLIQNKIEELQRKHSKQTISIKHFFTTSTYRRPSSQNISETPDSPGSSHENEVVLVDQETASTSSSSPKPVTARLSLAQKSAQELFGSMNSKIVSLTAARDAGIATKSHLTGLKTLKTDAKKQVQRLKTLQGSAERQTIFRKKIKEKLRKIHEKMPLEADDIPGTRDGPGRPRLEESQKGLLEAIVMIVTPNSSADIGRRSELIRSCSNLDDLHNRLKAEVQTFISAGYELSKLPRT